MSSQAAWKDVAAAFHVTIRKDTGMAVMLQVIGSNRNFWIPWSTVIRQDEMPKQDGEKIATYTFWIKVWILKKNGITYNNNTIRPISDLMSEERAEVLASDSENKEHFDEDEEQDMTDELDFSDSVGARRFE